MNIIEYGNGNGYFGDRGNIGDGLFRTGDIFEIMREGFCGSWEPYMLVVVERGDGGYSGILVHLRGGGMLPGVNIRMLWFGDEFDRPMIYGVTCIEDFEKALGDDIGGDKIISWRRVGPVVMDIGIKE